MEQAWILWGHHGDGHSDKIAKEGDRGFFFYDEMMWRHIEPFRKFVFESHVPDLVKALLQSETLIFYYDFLLIKTPGCYSGETPWHQDQGLWGYPLPTAVSIWTSLDPCTRENGCLQFWRGSHRAGTKEHIFLEGAIHKHLREEDVIRDEVEYIEMVPGDAVFFGGNVWHKSDPNTSRQRRLGVVAVYANHDEFESGIANSDWNPRRHAYWVCRET